MGLAGRFVSHDALGSGYDGDTQAAQNLGQLVRAGIHPQAGLGHAAQTGDDLLLTGAILQSDADDTLSAVVDELEVLDIAFIQQDLRPGS